MSDQNRNDQSAGKVLDERNEVSIDIANLVNFLEKEIEFLRDERKEPGWTKWAIGGSFATLFWILLGEFEKSLISPFTVMQFLIAISLLADFFFYIRGFVIDASQSYNTNGRYVGTERLAQNRLMIISLIFRYILVFVFVYLSVQRESFYLIVVGYLTATWHIFAYLILLVLSFTQFPIPIRLKPSGWIWKAASFSGILAIGYGAIIYFFHALETQSGVFDNLRVSLLIAALYYLMILIFRMPAESPLINSLVKVRREIVLGRLRHKDALEQVDIILLGFKLSNVLEDYIVRLVDLLNDANLKIQKIESYIEIIQKMLTENNVVSEKSALTVESINLSLNALMGELNEISRKRIPKALSPLRWRIEFIKRYSDSFSDEDLQVLEEIIGASDRLNRQIERVFGKLQNIDFEQL